MEKNNRIINDYGVEDVLYRIGIFFLVFALIVGVAADIFKIHLFTILGDTFGECPFYRLTHWYCPGCGGTRAAQAFLNGKFLLSLQYNAFVCYVMGGYVLFMVSHTIRIVTKGRIPGIRFHLYYVYIGIAIGIIQWAIKNAPLFY